MEVKVQGSGLGFVLFVVFLVLKLTHVVAWSWWWVTAPLWISAGLYVLILGLALAVAGIVAFFLGELCGLVSP
jgi:phosphoglycerol transferase MdoB-like AlkP superfamily enzyme